MKSFIFYLLLALCFLLSCCKPLKNKPKYSMTTLKHLNLTERDFELIIDGLDQVPNKNQVGELLGDIMVGMFAKDDPEAMAKFKAERELKHDKAKREKILMIEEIKILQGKLLMLKRYLIEQDALNQAQDIVNYLK